LCHRLGFYVLLEIHRSSLQRFFGEKRGIKLRLFQKSPVSLGRIGSNWREKIADLLKFIRLVVNETHRIKGDIQLLSDQSNAIDFSRPVDLGVEKKIVDPGPLQLKNSQIFIVGAGDRKEYTPLIQAL
jgi:hypothetical protein